MGNEECRVNDGGQERLSRPTKHLIPTFKFEMPPNPYNVNVAIRHERVAPGKSTKFIFLQRGRARPSIEKTLLL